MAWQSFKVTALLEAIEQKHVQLQMCGPQKAFIHKLPKLVWHAIQESTQYWAPFPVSNYLENGKVAVLKIKDGVTMTKPNKTKKFPNIIQAH